MSGLDLNYCFRENADFQPVNSPRRLAVIRRKDDCQELRDCLADPSKWLDRAEIVKDSRSTRAGLVKFADGRQVFIKCFNNRSLGYCLRYMFRRARPFREWASAWAMERAGIPSPRPMAALALYRWGIPGNAFLIRNSVPDVVPTTEFFNRLRASRELHDAYLNSIAAMFSKMHSAGIMHGDAKCSNIYVEDCGSNKYSYGFWDLLSCTCSPRTLTKTLRQKEVAHFAWSFAEIMNRGAEVPAVDETRIREEMFRRCGI